MELVNPATVHVNAAVVHVFAGSTGTPPASAVTVYEVTGFTPGTGAASQDTATAVFCGTPVTFVGAPGASDAPPSVIDHEFGASASTARAAVGGPAEYFEPPPSNEMPLFTFWPPHPTSSAL